MAVPLNELHTHSFRGDAVMEPKLPAGNVVETFMIGKTKIQICDDFVAKTPEAIAKVEDDFLSTAWQIINRLRADGVDI